MKNADGSSAFFMETQLILVGVMAIEDPLRDEVPGAIQAFRFPPPAQDKCRNSYDLALASILDNLETGLF